MKNKIMISILISMIFLIGIINAELSQNQFIFVDTQKSLVHYQGIYIDTDTNSNNQTSIIPTNTYFYYSIIQLPDLFLSVDYCNLTLYYESVKQFSLFNYSSTNVYNFNSANTIGGKYQTFFYALSGNDRLTADFSCHYTNINKYYLASGIFPAEMGLLSSSYSPQGCESIPLNDLIVSSQNDFNSFQTYDTFQNIISYDYEFWLIVEWIIKLMFFFIALGLVFVGIYYLYKFVKNIEESIK